MSDLPGVVAEQPTDYSRDSWLTDAGEVVRNAQTTVGGLGRYLIPEPYGIFRVPEVHSFP